MNTTVDAVPDGPHEELGQRIRSAGLEDSSGLRLSLLAALKANDYRTFNRMLTTPYREFCELRERMKP